MYIIFINLSTVLVGGGEGGIRMINRCVKLAHSAESDTSALSISSLTMDSPQPSSLSSTPSTPRKNTNEQVISSVYHCSESDVPCVCLIVVSIEDCD